MTFGSIAGTQPRFAGVYGEALAAVADVAADVLMTVGRDLDPATLDPVPAHVRVERWVDQSTVLGGAAAVIGHGGGGTTLGALAAGVPQVVVPLFAEDQHLNATARRRDRRGPGRGTGGAVDPRRPHRRPRRTRLHRPGPGARRRTGRTGRPGLLRGEVATSGSASITRRLLTGKNPLLRL